MSFKAWKEMSEDERVGVAFANWKRYVLEEDDEQVKKWYMILKKTVRSAYMKENSLPDIEV